MAHEPKAYGRRAGGTMAVGPATYANVEDMTAEISATAAPFDPGSFGHFVYVDYTFSASGTEFAATYQLRGAATLEFTERITFPSPVADTPARQVLARLLFLSCGLSYYKAACPPVLEVEAGLTAAERTFLATLIENGLGEFAYRNGLPAALRPRIDAVAAEASGTGDDEWQADGRPLVPIGGGKDSVVSLEILKTAGADPIAFSVNRFKPIDNCIAVGGVPSLHARRALDRRLIDANERGAYNGHIPVTAINSLIALLTAHAHGLGPVVMSNESSAEFGNLEWNGITVNHQWSKSIAFERLLRSTLEAGGLSADRYFSLLRPLSELAIAQKFAEHPAYFPVFTSCNRLFALDPAARHTSWCCNCPKCYFVYLILAPFVAQPVLREVFGRDLLNDPGAQSAYEEILGLEGHKPFECVGDYDEAALALGLAAAQPGWAGSALIPVLLKRLADAGKLPPGLDAEDGLAGEHGQLLRPGAEHHIPARFAAAAGVRAYA